MEVVHWYTHARRFPLLLGRFGLNGGTIPGGPYTIPQAITAFGVLAGLHLTRGLWGQFGALPNLAILLGVPVAAGLAVGKMPHGTRNPLFVLAGMYRCVMAPALGRKAGGAVKPARPHRVRHRLATGAVPATVAPSPDTAQPKLSRFPASWHRGPTGARRTGQTAAPAADPARPRAAALSGVQTLLATQEHSDSRST